MTSDHLSQLVPKLEPLPDLKKASNKELLEIWSKNRNSMHGVMAANEYMRRAYADQMKQTDWVEP